ncbi:unknown [Euproctis pseudoconspersa nucleopolyhedrovirus]|uniref:Uncharacterized protein n=1 Tax=Euproctis pseudoconspersa nucleopolyhedrovirus TaxID=307467 RepID=C3TWW4_9ABAC|nr:hypothetical protein EupsNPV_gp056 [Euproctis pseudoconspersa nucleopolyhedrovirus]ACO53506.1 unknown [Euproctis pseudoconspersa nucleopolyhedrovirus]QUJ09246.1 hypothetical protein Gyru_ORF51 [Gynaephora ruoergensis nucleopolyhedrovirus]
MQTLYALAMHKVIASTFDAVDLYLPHHYYVLLGRNYISCAEFVADNLDNEKSLKPHVPAAVYRDCIDNYVSMAIKINKFSHCKAYYQTFSVNPKKFLIRECVNSLLSEKILTNLERYDRESAQVFIKQIELFAETNLDMKKINLKAITNVMVACENLKKNYKFFDFSRGFDTLKLQIKTYATQYFSDDRWLFDLDFYCDVLMKKHWEKFNDDITLKNYLLNFASAALKEVDQMFLPTPGKHYTYSLYDIYNFTILHHPTIVASCKVANKDEIYKSYVFSNFKMKLFKCLKNHKNFVLTDVILKVICESCHCCTKRQR